MASVRMTQTKLVQELAAAGGVNNKVARAMLEKLSETAIAEVKKKAAVYSCCPASAVWCGGTQGPHGP